MIRIDRNFTLANAESALNKIEGGESTLQLPNRIAANAVGALAALIQLIITWSRTIGEQSTLKVYAHRTDKKALTNFAQTPFGLSALMMAHTIKTTWGEDTIPRREALLLALDYVKAMHSGQLSALNQFSRTLIPIICIDNARQYGLSSRLYEPDERTVRQRAEIEDLLRACLDTVTVWNADRGRKIIGPAASLLYEAFQNTHEHGRTDFRGNVLQNSMRGVLIGYHYIALNNLATMGDGCVTLDRYFSEWRTDRTDAQHAQFVEMSIFDSGPGLAQSWLAKGKSLRNGIILDNISLESELEAVTACLKKGGTTKVGDTSGNGLYRIMRVVQAAGGFIRFRTGRLSLVQTFHNQTHDADVLVTLEDLTAGGRPAVPRAWADGTLITVMLPLNRKGVQ